jgi:hypothetical protein
MGRGEGFACVAWSRGRHAPQLTCCPPLPLSQPPYRLQDDTEEALIQYISGGENRRGGMPGLAAAPPMGLAC